MESHSVPVSSQIASEASAVSSPATQFPWVTSTKSETVLSRTLEYGLTKLALAPALLVPSRMDCTVLSPHTLSALQDEHMPQAEEIAKPHARPAKLDGRAGKMQPVGLSGAPSLPQRQPAQRGPTLPHRRAPASAPAGAGPRAGAKATRPQPAPVLVQGASAGHTAALQAPQPAPALARSTSSGPSPAPQSAEALQQELAQGNSLQSGGMPQAAAGAPAAPVAPIVLGLPAAGLLPQLKQPTPQQQALLQAVMQDPGLQSVVEQPYTHASTQLLQAIFNQHIKALAPSQSTPLAQDVAQPQPQAYPTPHTQPQLQARAQSHAQPAAAVPAAPAASPSVKRFKPLEPVRGRRTADSLQQERATGSQGPAPLATHRIARPNSKQLKVVGMNL